MGEQRHLLLVSQCHECRPQRFRFVGQVCRPLLMTGLDVGAPDAVAQARGRVTEPGLGDADLHAAGLSVRAEHGQAQGVQQRDEGCFRCIGEGIAQRERAFGGQFGDEPVGKRTDGVVLLISAMRILHLAANGHGWSIRDIGSGSIA